MLRYWQDHPRLATLIVVLIGAGAFVFLYLLSSSAGPVRESTSSREKAGGAQQPEATPARPDLSSPAAAGSSQYVSDLEDVDFQKLMEPLLDEGKSVESIFFVDLNGDGLKEAVVLVRGPGGHRPLDWYYYALRDGRSAKLFERLGVAAGELQVEGPRLVESEGIYLEADPDCCPSRIKRTYYVWKDGSLVVLKVEAAPAGA